jgi:PEP-CTERM motif
MKRLRALALAVVALGIVPVKAHAADIFWDLAQLAGSNGDKGTSLTILNGGFGSLLLTTIAPTDVFVKGFGSPALDSEKGIGTCLFSAGAPCAGDEIGETVGTGSLFLNTSGLLAGSSLTHLFLGSLQTGEGWGVFFSDAAGACEAIASGSYTALASGTGDTDGATTGVDVTDVAATHHKCYRFDPFFATAGGHDYLLAAVTVSVPVPEPGTMGLLATGLVALTGAGLLRRRSKK